MTLMKGVFSVWFAVIALSGPLMGEEIPAPEVRADPATGADVSYLLANGEDPVLQISARTDDSVSPGRIVLQFTVWSRTKDGPGLHMIAALEKKAPLPLDVPLILTDNQFTPLPDQTDSMLHLSRADKEAIAGKIGDMEFVATRQKAPDTDEEEDEDDNAGEGEKF